jgi:hypothetical protein
MSSPRKTTALERALKKRNLAMRSVADRAKR